MGFMLPVALAFVVSKAVVAVMTESQVVYFGTGLALSALIALGVVVTAFTRRPLASYLIPHVATYSFMTPDHPVYRRVSAQVTVTWALAELGATGLEARHLAVSSASEFVLTRTAVVWPAMAVLVFLLIAYVRFRLDRHEWLMARTGRL